MHGRVKSYWPLPITDFCNNLAIFATDEVGLETERGWETKPPATDRDTKNVEACIVTESEWLCSNSPREMLRWSGAWNCSGTNTAGKPYLIKISTRKLRLFCCACCLARETPLSVVEDYEKCGMFDEFMGEEIPDRRWAEQWTERGENKPTLEYRAALLRDVVGNPYRPFADCICCVDPLEGYHTPTCPFTQLKAWLAWNDGTVQRLARMIYEERAFDRLPILADALEEAGCTNQDIINHCRGMVLTLQRHVDTGPYGYGPRTVEWVPKWVKSDAPHARGCFVLDLLLGKE